MKSRHPLNLPNFRYCIKPGARWCTPLAPRSSPVFIFRFTCTLTIISSSLPFLINIFISILNMFSNSINMNTGFSISKLTSLPWVCRRLLASSYPSSYRTVSDWVNDIKWNISVAEKYISVLCLTSAFSVSSATFSYWPCSCETIALLSQGVNHEKKSLATFCHAVDNIAHQRLTTRTCWLRWMSICFKWALRWLSLLPNSSSRCMVTWQRILTYIWWN